MHQVVDSSVQGFGETWNRLHNKFRVNSYLELPATKYDEACVYLRGKLPPVPGPQASATATIVHGAVAPAQHPR